MSHRKKQAQGSQPTGQRDGNQAQNPNRDQAERQRQQMPGSDPADQRQAQDPDGNRRNNQDRGMDSEEEQEDVPIRGSEREPGDSER